MGGRDTNLFSSTGLAGCSSQPNGGGKSGTQEKLQHKSLEYCNDLGLRPHNVHTLACAIGASTNYCQGGICSPQFQILSIYCSWVFRSLGPWSSGPGSSVYSLPIKNSKIFQTSAFVAWLLLPLLIYIGRH